ncbi:unnamed protein product [Gadus morhua 'NCC']
MHAQCLTGGGGCAGRVCIRRDVHFLWALLLSGSRGIGSGRFGAEQLESLFLDRQSCPVYHLDALIAVQS